LQRIERSRHRAKADSERPSQEEAREASPLEWSDTVKVEVAFVDGRELYSWPGAEDFDDRPLHEIIGFGTVATGDFAVDARNLFVRGLGKFRFAGEEELAGRTVVRYDYEVPPWAGRHVVSDGEHEAGAPYAGSIWADPESADLVRMEMHTVEVPPPLKVAAVLKQVDYAGVVLGGQRFLVPASERLTTRFRSGEESVNEAEFRNCRAYGSESLLSFGEPPDSTAGEGPASRRQDFELPPGLSLTLRLDTAIEWGQAAVGDRIEATLQSAIKRDGKLLAAKGSKAVGRIRCLQRFTYPEDYFIVALELTELRTTAGSAPIRAELVDVVGVSGLVDHTVRRGGRTVLPGFRPARTVGPRLARALEERLPGTGEFHVWARRLRIQPGVVMLWKTRAFDEGH
jgi:hypothetical protein